MRFSRSAAVQVRAELVPGPADPRLGRWALVPVGADVAVVELGGEAPPEPEAGDAAGAAGEDARTLAARFNARGNMERAFLEALAELTEEPAQPGWPVQGPRTVLPLLESYGRLGRTPRQHHSAWVTQAGITGEGRSRFEHETLLTVLEAALTFDQLNVSSLGCMEVLARRVQLIEEARRIGGSSAPSYDGAAHFMGEATGSTGSIVVPTLAQHVAAAMHAEAQVAKGRRKLREERVLRRKPPGKKKKDGEDADN